MTTASFDSTLRTRLVFGPGCLDRLGELAAGLGGHRVLLVTDPGIVQAGHASRAEALLRAAGLEVAVFDAVRENPTTLDVDRGLEAARAASVDLFVGLGGGSSIDTAKGTFKGSFTPEGQSKKSSFMGILIQAHAPEAAHTHGFFLDVGPDGGAGTAQISAP